MLVALLHGSVVLYILACLTDCSSSSGLKAGVLTGCHVGPCVAVIVQPRPVTWCEAEHVTTLAEPWSGRIPASLWRITLLRNGALVSWIVLLYAGNTLYTARVSSSQLYALSSSDLQDALSESLIVDCDSHYISISATAELRDPGAADPSFPTTCVRYVEGLHATPLKTLHQMSFELHHILQ